MVVMTCKEIQESIPDLALGLAPVSGENAVHLRSCPTCASKLEEMRKTMALLDEWQAPEPSAYFDTRLNARLREQSKAPAKWWAWLRRPAMALVATVLVALSISLTLFRGNSDNQSVQPGTAVSDLQQLDKNHDLYSDFDVLDDLQVQSNVTATP
jgi:anti-sigma factor RsiW